MTNIILWRHAEAEIISRNGLDADRVLTKKGQKDAARMAKWLDQHLPQDTEIICSPTRRCLETAKALQQLNHKPMRIENFMRIDADVRELAKEVLRTDNNKTLLLIGHQPNIGELIGLLQGEGPANYVVKKGAVWWLRQRLVGDAQQKYIFTVQHPDYL